MIAVSALTKYYGTTRALGDVSFSVTEGESAALLGANGSGKTTTMRILAGYLQGTSGHAQIAGFDVGTQSLEVRRHVGYLPETTPAYTDLTVTDDLLFAGKLRGLRKPGLARRVKTVLAACRLERYAMTRIAKLSKGYRQRLGIARAILHEPPVLILDEPTIGLDPAQVVETRNLIRELARRSTILLSTHVLAEVKALCGRIIILHEGTVAAAGTPADLAAKLGEGRRIEVEIEGPAEEIGQTLRAIPGVASVNQGARRENAAVYSIVTVPDCDPRQQIGQMAVERHWPLSRLAVADWDMEDIFLRLIGERRQDSSSAAS